MLTAKRLLELGYTKKQKKGVIYFQKGIIMVVYRDTGTWDFCADQGIEMCGIPIITEEDLNYYIQNPKKKK